MTTMLTLAEIQRIEGVDEETAATVLAILTRPLSRDFTHEHAIKACDEAMSGHGIESVDPEGAPSFVDGRIAMCPPFSYVNLGDSYAATLARDHEKGVWLISCWAELLETVEKAHKLGDFEEFEEEPDTCPACNGSTMTLEHFPHSARGPSYSWVCESCGHHAFAVEGYKPPSDEDDADDEDTE